MKSPCSPDDIAAIASISPSHVTYCPGIPTKRFARQIQGATELSDAQRKWVWDIVYRFRRQIADKRLIQLALTKRRESYARPNDGGL